MSVLNVRFLTRVYFNTSQRTKSRKCNAKKRNGECQIRCGVLLDSEDILYSEVRMDRPSVSRRCQDRQDSRRYRIFIGFLCIASGT